MQRAGDRQKMLAAHAALLSDPRLPMQVTDCRSIHLLEGRVITHGEEENSGRVYMLLEGTDARVHFIYHSREIASAWQRGRLRPNSFVRLRRLSDDRALSVSRSWRCRSHIASQGAFSPDGGPLASRWRHGPLRCYFRMARRILSGTRCGDG